MHAFVLFYAHKNKNINYNQISLKLDKHRILATLLLNFSHDSSLRLDPSSYMLSPFNNTSMANAYNII